MLNAKDRDDAVRNLRGTIRTLRRGKYVSASAQNAIASIYRAINLLEEESGGQR